MYEKYVMAEYILLGYKEVYSLLKLRIVLNTLS